MFVSIFAVNSETKEKVFRSSIKLTQSTINFYISEFLGETLDYEGVISKERYKFIYTSLGSVYYVAMVNHDAFYTDAFESIRYIRDSSGTDFFEILFAIDNLLYDENVIGDNVQAINLLESQNEVMHKMMVEDKQKEMRRKAKENRRKEMEEEMMKRYMDTVSPNAIVMGNNDNNLSENNRNIQQQKVTKKKKTIEKSEKPLLVILTEKLNVEIDKENFIKTNQVSGEMSMVINKEEFRHVSLKMVGLQKKYKYSPYLDKNQLNEGKLHFEKERQLNKNIPLLKWSSKLNELPVTFEYWTDEDSDNICNTFTFSANRKVKDLKVKINKNQTINLVVEGETEEDEDYVYLCIRELNKGESESFEVKYDIKCEINCVFPLQLEFSEGIESNIAIERAMLGNEKTDGFEFRRMLEIERYDIVSE